MIELENVCLSYGGVRVLHDCSLKMSEGDSMALMGPSGCGKTSLLRVIAGLQRPDSGSVRVRGRISAVFQEPRLFPWMTAEENIRAVMNKGADAGFWLEAVGLEEAAGKYPEELSGGMQQRIAICRALAYGGDLLLMDEPLKGLDRELKDRIAALIKRESRGKTLLVATHDEAEAKSLAGGILRFQNGCFARENL